MVSKLLNRRALILFALLLIVPLGILSKAYGGVGQQWVRDYSGDVLYEIFWCLLIFWFVPSAQTISSPKSIYRSIALAVFAVTCIIEISQLWFYLVPISLRSTFIWRMLLGAGFDWWDFPHYALGSLIGWGIIRQIGQTHYSR